MNGRERILRHLRGEPVDHLPLMPITMMFAGDHIGVKYREYATNYRVLVDAQIRVAEDYGFDYVSCISDPAREAADCGAAVRYPDNQPPALDESNALLADKTKLLSLRVPDPYREGSRMFDRIQAAALFRQKVGGEKLIEGWIEGPMAEAADLRGINTIMLDFFDDPKFVQDLFEFVLEMELRFAKAQLEAGADLIGIGDAAASLVGPDFYKEFVVPYEKRLIDGIKQAGGLVRLHICGDTRAILQPMGQLGCDIVDLDSQAPLKEGREAMGPDQVLLGNIDPVRTLRDGTPESIEQALAECHREAGPRYIVGAGCEIPRETPPENVRAMLHYAQSHRPEDVPQA